MMVKGGRYCAFHSLFHFEVLLVCDCLTVERRVCEIAAGENFLSFCLVFLKFLLCDNGYTWDSLGLTDLAKMASNYLQSLLYH